MSLICLAKIATLKAKPKQHTAIGLNTAKAEVLRQVMNLRLHFAKLATWN
jgi:hypothetical protein